MQSKKGSLMESITNILIGLGVALLTQNIVFPLFGLEVSGGQHLLISLIFTFVSLARSYFIRRVYNRFNFFGGLR